MLKVGPPVISPADFERIIKPMVGRFADSMCSRFVGNEVLPTTLSLFLMLTDTTCPQMAADWLYAEKSVEQLRRIEQRRRANGVASD